MFNPAAFRDYQLEAAYAPFHYFDQKHGNPLIAMPMGSGKSWVIAAIIQLAFYVWPPSKIIMATHKHELITQNLEKLLTVWPSAPVGVYSAELERRESHMPITYAGIQSIFNKGELFGYVDFLVIDEAHWVSDKDETMYLQLFTKLKEKNPRLKIIGLSATCFRLGLGMLTQGPIFTDIIYDITDSAGFLRLVNAGYLCPLVAQKTNYQIDASEVRTNAEGEFVEKALEEFTNQEQKNRIITNEMCQLFAARNRWLIFAVGIAHAETLNRMLLENGIPSVAIHSKLSKTDKKNNFDAFKYGYVRAAVTMNQLTTGVDIAEIDAIGCTRNTNSSSLWGQMLGRGDRVAPWANKLDCLVGDFTTNTERLGPIDNLRIPQNKSERKRKSVAGPPVVKVCGNPLCKKYVAPSVTKCPYCNYEFPRRANFQLESSGLSVMSLDPTKKEDAICKYFDVVSVTFKTTRGNPRNGKPPTMLVTYYCTIAGRFYENVCIEHQTGARNHAIRWWNERSREPMPPTVAEAVAIGYTLRVPKQIFVHINNDPLPRILDYVYH